MRQSGNAWSIRNGRNRRVRGTPVAVQADVLSARITERSSSHELLSTPSSGGWGNGRKRHRYQRPCTDRQSCGSAHAG